MPSSKQPDKLIVEEARRRAEVFRRLDEYLKAIARAVKELDENAEVYLFGSVAEGRHLLSSDIDVLIVTDVQPGVVLAKLWEKGVKEPFEIHVTSKERLGLYKGRAKLVKISL